MTLLHKSRASAALKPTSEGCELVSKLKLIKMKSAFIPVLFLLFLGSGLSRKLGGDHHQHHHHHHSEHSHGGHNEDEVTLNDVDTEFEALESSIGSVFALPDEFTQSLLPLNTASDESDESDESNESGESDESEESDESDESDERIVTDENNDVFDASKYGRIIFHIIFQTYIFRATRTILDDGTTKLCIEKEAFREELRYIAVAVGSSL